MRNKKLGKGISALLGDEIEAKSIKSYIDPDRSNSNFINIPIVSIIAGIYQPRKNFCDDELQGLAESIIENGIIQPIIVRKSDQSQEIFEIISGERRFKAAKIAGLTEIPAIIRDIENNKALEIGILENVQRLDLSPIEESMGYKQLMTEFSYTQDEISKKLGKSRSHIANSLRLLHLPEEIQKMINDNLLSVGHAKIIMNRDDIIDIAKQIIANSLSVRETEELCRSQNEYLSEIIEKKTLLSDEEKEIIQNIRNKLRSVIGDIPKIKIIFNKDKNKGQINISYNNLRDLKDLSWE